MSKVPNAPGGSTEGPGGADDKESKQSENQTDGDQKPSNVSREAYDKVLGEAKKAREKLAAIEAEARKRNESELTEKQEFKKLYESAKAEVEEWKGKYTGLDTDVQESRKLYAFQGKLSGKLPAEYWGLVDISQIASDPDTGKVDDASVARYAKEFEKKHSRLIDKPVTAKMPNQAPAGGGQEIGFAAEIKATKTQKEYDAVMRKYGKSD